MNAQDIKHGRILGQSRPSGTSAASIYSPPKNLIASIKGIAIANNTGSAAAYSVYLDVDGTTYDQSTAIAYSVSLAANSTVLLEFVNPGLILVGRQSGNLAIQSGTGNALTFTVYGYEVGSGV